MASRRETQQQLARMEEVLRRELRRGPHSSAKLPPVRQLAEEHGVSVYIAHQAMQKLKKEGLLQTRGKLGAFASVPRPSEREIYAITSPHDHDPERWLLVRRGFEARIAERGGAIMVLGPDFDELREWPHWKNVAGVLEFPVFLPFDVSCPRVRILEREVAQRFQSDNTRFDVVHMDNRDGGAQAVAHLLFEGHREIAFLGVHHPDFPVLFSWSLQREHGWRSALEEAGLKTKNLSFQPRKPWQGQNNPSEAQESEFGLDAAQQLCEALDKRDITGVVAANDATARVLIEELQRRNVSVRLWPSIVGFDGEDFVTDSLLSSLRLPWEEAGAAAADLLWERRHDMSPPEIQTRWVRMRLIPRLTCRPGWGRAPQTATAR
jgi:hypothetical protein